MGNFETDTNIVGGNGQYEAVLSRDWEIWGPNGGYVSAIALRAAGAESRFNRPASFSCQYLQIADFDKIQITVKKLKEGSTAEALKVSIEQKGKHILEAFLWLVAADITGYEHEFTTPLDVKKPGQLKSIEELLKPEERPPYIFWNNLDRKPVIWTRDNKQKNDSPRWREWFRFRPQATFKDTFVDAARSLLLIDTMQWPAVFSMYTPELPYLAPSLDLNIQFHKSCPDDEWLLCDASANIARNGIINGSAIIWSEKGDLLASGISTLLCRPASKYGL